MKLSINKLTTVIEIRLLGSSGATAKLHPSSDQTQIMDEDAVSVSSLESLIPDEPLINLN